MFRWIGHRQTARGSRDRPDAAGWLLAGLALTPERLSIRSVQSLRRRHAACSVRAASSAASRTGSSTGATALAIAAAGSCLRRPRGMCDASAVVTPGVVPSIRPSGSTRRSHPSPGSTDSPTELNPTVPIRHAKSRVESRLPGNGGVQLRTGPQGTSYQTRGPDSGTRIARRGR